MQANAFPLKPREESPTSMTELARSTVPTEYAPCFPSRQSREFLLLETIPWELKILLLETTWWESHQTETSGTSLISQEIEDLLNWLLENGVRLTDRREIRRYLMNSPDLIEVIPQAVDAAQRYLPGAQLVLRVYRDPEIEDAYLTLYVRLREYDESVMDKIESAESEFLHLLTDKSGWLLLTTDFEEPEEDVL